MQMRASADDERFYDPNRDLAHCYDQVLMEVAKRLEAGTWSPLSEYLEQHGIDQDQLGEACRAYCDFIVHTTDDQRETLEAVLKRVGWFEIPEPAQVAYVAYIGLVITGMFFKGRRDATLLDEQRISSPVHLRHYGRRSAKIMTMPRWRRWIYYLLRAPARWYRRKTRKRARR